jgi:ferredoxin
MAIKKVWIEDGCIACNLSETICPDVFEVEEQARVKEGVDFSLYEEEIREAAEQCPVQVIKFSEE